MRNWILKFLMTIDNSDNGDNVLEDAFSFVFFYNAITLSELSSLDFSNSLAFGKQCCGRLPIL